MSLINFVNFLQYSPYYLSIEYSNESLVHCLVANFLLNFPSEIYN